MTDSKLQAMIREALASNDPMLGYKAFLESQRQGIDPISRVAVPAPEGPEDLEVTSRVQPKEDAIRYIDYEGRYCKSLTKESKFGHVVELFFDKIEFASLKNIGGFNREVFATVDMKLKNGILTFGEIIIEFALFDDDPEDELQEEIYKVRSQFESEVNKTLSDIDKDYLLSTMKEIKFKNTMLKLRKYSESIVALQKEISEKQRACGQAYLEKLRDE